MLPISILIFLLIIILILIICNIIINSFKLEYAFKGGKGKYFGGKGKYFGGDEKYDQVFEFLNEYKTIEEFQDYDAVKDKINAIYGYDVWDMEISTYDSNSTIENLYKNTVRATISMNRTTETEIISLPSTFKQILKNANPEILKNIDESKSENELLSIQSLSSASSVSSSDVGTIESELENSLKSLNSAIDSNTSTTPELKNNIQILMTQLDNAHLSGASSHDSGHYQNKYNEILEKEKKWKELAYKLEELI